MSDNDHREACKLPAFNAAQGDGTRIQQLADLTAFVGDGDDNIGLVSVNVAKSIKAYTDEFNPSNPLRAVISFGFNDDPNEVEEVMEYLISQHGVKNMGRVEGLQNLDVVVNGTKAGYQRILRAVLTPFVKGLIQNQNNSSSSSNMNPDLPQNQSAGLPAVQFNTPGPTEQLRQSLSLLFPSLSTSSPSSLYQQTTTILQVHTMHSKME